MATPSFIGCNQNSNRFTEHPAIGPEFCTPRNGSPDCSPCLDGIDAAENRLPHGDHRPEAILDNVHLNRPIHFADRSSQGRDLRHADVFHQVTLSGDVGFIDVIEVNQLQSPGTNRSQLQGNLPANRTDTNDSDGELGEPLAGTRSCCRENRSLEVADESMLGLLL